MAKVSKSPDEVQPTDVGLKSLVPGTTPEPLEELSAEERAEWRKFTSRMPMRLVPAGDAPDAGPVVSAYLPVTVGWAVFAGGAGRGCSTPPMTTP